MHDVASELESLLRRYPGGRSDTVKKAISFLEVKVMSMALESAGKSKATREKAADAWERKFLKEALGEDV